MSARRRRRALDAIARRYRVMVCEVEGSDFLASDAFETPGGTIVVVYTASASVAQVRRMARLAAMRFRGRGILGEDLVREHLAATRGVQGRQPVSVRIRAWERARARRGWVS